MVTDHGFPRDYQEAHGRFLRAAAGAGAALTCLELDARGPRSDALSIPIAWLGDKHPRRVVLHSSGLHGVEGFAGSAIQTALLEQPPSLPPGEALVLVHGLNPYGMAWLRRVNESNVDLNRNFPGPSQSWRGSPAAYGIVNPWLNPPSPPAQDGFLWRALGLILRHGYHTLEQAIAGGQHDYPQGLFYGGAGLEPGPGRYLAWLTDALSGVERLLAIDVHTGLGRWGRSSLFLESGQAPTAPAFVKSQTAPPYASRGGLCAALPNALPGTRVTGVVQEFGAYPALRVLHGLREENRWHHYGDGDLAHPAKHRLRSLFCPNHPSWRRAVLAQGLELARQAIALDR